MTPTQEHGCEFHDVPQFDRLNYFYGQMLGARDFQTEQDFFRDKMMLLNRCLHGYGIACGLTVSPGPKQPDCKDPVPPIVLINPGIALDPCGHELIVREPKCVDLWKELSEADKKKVAEAKGKYPVYVTLAYKEVAIEKQQVDLTDQCLASNTFTYAKKRDSICVEVITDPPPTLCEESCDPCCHPPKVTRLWLAQIDGLTDHGPISHSQIHNEIRRPLSLFRPTTITGINWVHGARYSEDDAEKRLKEGLRIRFSQKVLSTTLRDGILDIWATDDWSGPGSGELRSLAHKLVVPVDQFETEELQVKVECRGLKGDERVLIILRTDFVLDVCGRPVDGNHVGGFVPLLGDAPPLVKKQSIIPESILPDHVPKFGPWQSGNGTPGGTFTSWFFVECQDGR